MKRLSLLIALGLICSGCASVWKHADGRTVECRAEGPWFDPFSMLALHRKGICEDAATIAGFQRVK